MCVYQSLLTGPAKACVIHVLSTMIEKIMRTHQTSYNSTDDMVMIELSGWITTTLFVLIRTCPCDHDIVIPEIIHTRSHDNACM